MVTLPPMPTDLATPCRDPGVRAGHDIREEFARNRAALAQCRNKHGGAVEFYDGVRAATVI